MSIIVVAVKNTLTDPGVFSLIPMVRHIDKYQVLKYSYKKLLCNF